MGGGSVRVRKGKVADEGEEKNWLWKKEIS